MRRYVANVDLDALGVNPGDMVVDVGGGAGALAEQLAASGLNVIGVEPAAYLRERFAERMARFGAGTSVLDGTVEQLPFADGEVGAVVITEVLEHVDDPYRAMCELHRVVRPDGVVCLSVPTSFTELVFWRMHPRYAENATHVRIYTRPELRRMIDATGFEVVRWEGRNFRPAVSWVFHALLRSPSDHAGVVLRHLWVDRLLNSAWRVLEQTRLIGPVEWLGNRLWPKSWYVYCRRRPGTPTSG
jgi:2-polyprenyl-3-methyl-5-hydroxy-6-metoxy-1,4-benzoquinol methylase